MVLEGGQHVGVHQVHRGDRELGGVEPAPGVAGMAVDGGLQVDLADALQMAEEEGIDGHELAGVGGGSRCGVRGTRG